MTAPARPDPATPDYTFDNDHPEQAERHDLLAGILDEFTISRLSSLGDWTGRRCLEVGAGKGSIAGWLADRGGRVLATDVNTRHLQHDRGYAVVRHDLVTDPIPDGPWDLIHVRLVLEWLPEPRSILRRLAAGLVPGGALAIEQWDGYQTGLVLTAPDPEAATLFDAYWTIVQQIIVAGGVDRGWPWQVHDAMVTAGLVDVDTLVHARSWPGGSAGALLHAANIRQLRTRLLDAGMTGEQLDHLCRLLGDPRTVVRGLLTVSTIGRRRPAS